MAESQAEALYHRIRRRIIRGTYQPGRRLTESALAEAHGTSRTPVREVLSRLQAEGLVECTPNRGCRVSELTVGHLHDVCAVRSLLEAEAAAGAARCATSEQLVRIRELASYRFTVGDADAYEEAMTRNLQFHLAVAEASGNRVLSQLVESCLVQMNRFWAVGYALRVLPGGDPETSDEPMRRNIREHRMIVEALERGDAEAAASISRAHVERNRELMISRLMGPSSRNVTLTTHPGHGSPAPGDD